jgi:hypothetical protein
MAKNKVDIRIPSPLKSISTQFESDRKSWERIRQGEAFEWILLATPLLGTLEAAPNLGIS